MNAINEYDPLKYGLVVRLSPAEAKFLAGAMSRIGGDPQTSRRRHADSIFDQLRKRNIPWTDNDDMNGGISCRSKGA